MQNLKEGKNLFNSLASLANNVATVAAAPVKVAVDLADATIRPVAEIAEDMAATSSECWGKNKKR